MAEPTRRFVPEPIETTFQSFRKGPQPTQQHIGPNPELTPEASPKSPSPPPPQLWQDYQPRRRFAPQLIETSRRTFRLGDSGPATKPTDKTDITPGTNHIYKSRPRRRRDDTVLEDDYRPQPPTRRETEDEGVLEYMLELAAKEAERQMQEDALAAFPNSRAREGGVAHFYFDEGSGSDESMQTTPAEGEQPTRHKARRKSSNLEMNWWHTHMQKYAEKVSRQKGEEAKEEEEEKEPQEKDEREQDILMRSDSDLDRMELPAPPDAMWTTTNTRIAPEDRRDSMAEQAEALTLASRLARDKHNDPAALHVPLTSSSAAPQRQAAQFHLQLQPQSQDPDRLQPSSAPREAPANQSPFGRGFASLGLKPDEAQLRRLRKLRSPPMLGRELEFRQCPSPKTTKLETDHPFVRNRCAHDAHHRDITGEGGLWRGYCCRSESTGGYIVPADLQPQKMIATPFPPATPREPAAYDYDSQSVSEEPSSIQSTSVASSDSSGSFPSSMRPSYAEYRPSRLGTGEPKGLHMLHGLDERLLQEKSRAERDEKIAAEFDDAFVTQVYNYLSLGYPAMARGFDEELSKISRVTVDELEHDDKEQMAKGHMLEMKLEDTPEEARCPRWRALRVYITEWARQHPDLDNLDPLAWGVRERRGSWAI